MKILFISQLLLALSSSVAAIAPVSYDGYKVARVKTQGRLASVQEQLAFLSYDEWERSKSSHIDIALHPDHLNAFNELGLEYSTMHEDLGASIAAEFDASSHRKRQVSNGSWFDSYHSYDEHKQYWRDLRAAFPDNSEPVSSGTSYEGRDIFGLHLWGADGPGKPVVLWHSTVS